MPTNPLGAFLVAATLASATLPARAEGPVIVAGHDVLATFASRIAGDTATISMPVPDGTDPAQWQPRISQITAVQSADLILLNGAGYEEWAGRVSLPRAAMVDTTAGVADALIHRQGGAHSHGNGPEHSHDGIAPVTWLDFDLAAEQARAVADALTRRFPEQAAVFAANLQTLQAQLSAMNRQGIDIGTALRGQMVLSAQPGYEYFARAYGLTTTETTFDPTQNATDDQWRALDAVVERTGARIMLWDAPPPAATAAGLSSRGIAVVILRNAANPPAGRDPLAAIEEGLTALAAAASPD